MKALFISLIAMVAASCDSSFKVKTVSDEVSLDRDTCLAHLDDPACKQFLGLDFKIHEAKPLAAKSGETVVLHGENFTDGMTVKINGQDVTPTVTSPTEASFVMPVDVRNGKAEAAAQKHAYSQPFLLYSHSKDDYPLSTDEPSEVCQGKKFYNAQGDLTEGTRICNEASLVACTTEGQVGCVTTDALKPVVVAQIAPGDVALGKTILGIAGSATLESHSNCMADGSVGCVTTNAFKAADMASVTAGNIKAGVTIAGQARWLPLGNASPPER